MPPKSRSGDGASSKGQKMIAKAIQLLTSLKKQLGGSGNSAQEKFFDGLLAKLSKPKCSTIVVAVTYHNVGIMFFNKRKYPQAISMLKNAALVYDAHKEHLKANKCRLVHGKALLARSRLVGKGFTVAQAIETMQQGIAVLEDLLSREAGKSKSKEGGDTGVQARYELALAYSRLGLLERELQRKSTGSGDADADADADGEESDDAAGEDEDSSTFVQTLWKALACWADVVAETAQAEDDASGGRRESASQHLTMIAELFQLLDLAPQRIAALQVMSDGVDSDGMAAVARAELAETYSSAGHTAAASAHFEAAMAMLAGDDADADDRGLDDPAMREFALLHAQFLSSTGPVDAGREQCDNDDGGDDDDDVAVQAQLRVVKLQERLKAQPKRSRDDYLSMAECAHIIGSMELRRSRPVEAFNSARQSLALWNSLLRSLSSSGDAAAPASSDGFEGMLKQAFAPCSNEAAASSGGGRVTGRASRARVALGLARSLQLLGRLYELQGLVRPAEYYFTKGVLLGESADAPNICARFLIELARLECKRNRLLQSQGYLDRVDRLEASLASPGEVQGRAGGRDLVVLCRHLRQGDLHRRSGRVDQANDCYEEAAAVLTTLASRNYAERLDGASSLSGVEQPDSGAQDDDDDDDDEEDDDLLQCLPLASMLAGLQRRQGGLVAGLGAGEAGGEDDDASPQQQDFDRTVDDAVLAEAQARLEAAVELAARARSPAVQQAKALFSLGQVQLQRAENDSSGSSLWSCNPQPRKAVKKGKRSSKVKTNRPSLAVARATLLSALQAADGVHIPQVTKDICGALVEAWGREDPWRTVFFVNMARGVTARHQVLARLSTRLDSSEQQGQREEADRCDVDDGDDDDNQDDRSDVEGAARDLADALDSLDLSGTHADDADSNSNNNNDRRGKWALQFELFQAKAGPTDQGLKVFMDERLPLLPREWNIVNVVLCPSRSSLVLCRFQGGNSNVAPVVLRIPLPRADDGGDSDDVPCNALDAVAARFAGVMAASKDTTSAAASMNTKAEKEAWWKDRHALDDQLGALLADLEHDCLGPWRGLLCGQRRGEEGLAALEEARTRIIDSAVAAKLLGGSGGSKRGRRGAAAAAPDCSAAQGLVQCLLEAGAGGEILSKHHVLAALVFIVGWTDCPFLDQAGANEVVDSRSGQESMAFHAWVSVVEGELDKLEAPQSQDGGLSGRHPTILIMSRELQQLPWESMPVLRGHAVTRAPSLDFVFSRLPSYSAAGRDVRDGVVCSSGVKGKTYYVLNPSEDLVRTQKTFEKAFEHSRGWTGTSGEAPSQATMATALRDSDLFVYCGHGAGEQYMGREELAKLDVDAIALLMGCSSGVLKYDRAGDYEPHGMALAYMVAGCPSVLANLWDVTDKDIDRFSHSLMSSWVPSYAAKYCTATESGKGKGKGRGRRESTKRRPHAAGTSLADAVVPARDVCKLPYLVGAAPVCYGVPAAIFSE